MTNGLTNSGVPLGGLGAGSVELRTDGLFHEWQIMNNAPLGVGPEANCAPDTSFFGMQVRANDGCNRSVLLATAPAAYPTGQRSFLSNPYAMPWLEYAESVDTDARVPFTEMKYQLASLPVAVELEAFSPFIPLDAKNSGLPLAYFTLNLTNTSDAPLTVSLFQALRNLVGYAHPQTSSNMTLRVIDGGAAICFEREGLPDESSDDGSISLGAWSSSNAKVSHVFHPRSNRDLWEPLRENGQFENVDLGGFEGEIGNMGEAQRARLRQGPAFGALCLTVELAAGESTDVTFALAWDFPNFWEADYKEKGKTGERIGHRYSEWFDSSGAVLDYARANAADLRERSMEFVDAYYSSTQPRWLLDAVAAQLTTLVKASWWDRRGRFGIWEGLGCCGLQTTDITYYGSFPILQFFPEIEFSQMRLSRDNVEVKGRIPHLMKANFSCCDVDKRGRIDLNPQFILLIWRDVLWSGDLDYAREMWPTVKDAIAYFDTLDTDGDGLPNNTGPDQTYDQFPLRGTSSFVGFLYAASLRAVADMAELLGENETAASTRATLADALTKLDEQLWTGEFYRLSHDPVDGADNDGVMADQINGDWFVRQTTGEGLLDDDRARSALGRILKDCRMPQGYLANCAWPAGDGVSIGRHTANQADWPWTGVEYGVAAHLVLMGMEEEGVSVTRDVWERHERAGLRFNHVECGGHYYRALSSWAVYLALTGFAANAIKQSLTLSMGKAESRFVVCTPSSWSVAEANGEGLTLTVRRGELVLKQLRLRGVEMDAPSVAVNGEGVSCEVTRCGDTTEITLAEAVTLRRDDSLRVG